MLKTNFAGVVRHVPVIFPDVFCHDDMALFASEALRASTPSCANIGAVSAGFVNLHAQATYGKSVTLDLQAKVIDARTINNYDYWMGIQS